MIQITFLWRKLVERCRTAYGPRIRYSTGDRRACDHFVLKVWPGPAHRSFVLLNPSRKIMYRLAAVVCCALSLFAVTQVSKMKKTSIINNKYITPIKCCDLFKTTCFNVLFYLDEHLYIDPRVKNNYHFNIIIQIKCIIFTQ